MESSEALQKKWVKIYPSYIDKALKHSEGRKVSSAIAVENPTCRDIFIVCSEILKLNCSEQFVNILIIFRNITQKIGLKEVEL
jgi:hypothetical protein